MRPGPERAYAAERQPQQPRPRLTAPSIEASRTASNRPRSASPRADLAAAGVGAWASLHGDEAVSRIDAIFEIEREINGLSPDERQAVRDTRSRPLVDDPHAWLRPNRGKSSANAPIAKANDYMLKRWPAFTRFLDDAASASPTMPPTGPSGPSRSVAGTGPPSRAPPPTPT